MNAKFHLRLFVALASLFLLPACVYVRSAEIDKVSGPIDRAVTGSQVLADGQDPAALGRLLGRIGGEATSSALDDRDVTLMSALALSVLDHGGDDRVETWRNRHSRHHGSFVAMSTWSTSDRIICRRFSNTIYIDRTETRSNGTACRQRDGTWAVTG